MYEHPGFWAEQVRIAPHEPARVIARRELAAAIRRLAHETLQVRGVPDHVADDEANFLAFDLGRRIELGHVHSGSEDAYIRRCARNRANAHYREISGLRTTCELDEDDTELADIRDPESLLAESQDAALVACRVKRLRALIAIAPPGFAAVLHEVYVTGTLIEEVARRELEIRVARGDERPDDPHALRRARASVDQRLHRARDWIRDQMRITFAGESSWPWTPHGLSGPVDHARKAR